MIGATKMNSDEIKVGVSTKDGQLGFMFTRGGLRAGSGRKSIGVTKKVSLTLTEEVWGKLERDCTDNKRSRSDVIREILESYYSN